MKADLQKAAYLNNGPDGENESSADRAGESSGNTHALCELQKVELIQQHDVALQALQKELREAIDRLKQQTDERESMLARLEAAERELVEARKLAEMRLAEREIEQTTLQKRIANLDADLASAREECTEAHRKYEELELSRQKLEEEAKVQRQRADTEEERSGRLEREVAELRQSAATATADMSREVDGLRAKCAEAEKASMDAEARLAKVEMDTAARAKELARDVAAAKERVKSLQTELDNTTKKAKLEVDEALKKAQTIHDEKASKLKADLESAHLKQRQEADERARKE
ncbi:hypothetical protein HK405_013290, partial [Cladochytrium tenue]